MSHLQAQLSDTRRGDIHLNASSPGCSVSHTPGVIAANEKRSEHKMVVGLIITALRVLLFISLTRIPQSYLFSSRA